MNKENVLLTKTQFKKEFAKLMGKTSMSENLSQDECLNVIRELHDFIQPYIPSKLYRFRKCGIDEVISFEQGTIPMCIAKKFPDKYDSNVFYDYETLTDRFNKSFVSVMPCIIQALRNNPKAFPETPISSVILHLIKKGMPDNEMLVTLRVAYESIVEEMRSEITKQEEKPRIDKRTKIGCFTERINSKFMWDHYADGYKGFALEYDFRKWYTLDNVNLYPIIYSSQMLDATDMVDRMVIADNYDKKQVEEPYKDMFEALKTQLRQLFPVDLMYYIKMYLYKDKADYGHEREWRMLKIEKGPSDQDYISIPDKGCLKAIYYGLGMEPRFKAHLRMIAKAKGIREYDVVLDKNSRKYSLKVVPLGK